MAKIGCKVGLAGLFNKCDYNKIGQENKGGTKTCV